MFNSLTKQARWAHLVPKAAGIGEQSASLKLTEQIITDLLCCLNVFQRNLFRGTP
jgi:hypothetical protein